MAECLTPSRVCLPAASLPTDWLTGTCLNYGAFSNFWKDCLTLCPLKRNQHTLPLDVGEGSPYRSPTAPSPSCTRLPFPGGRPASIYPSTPSHAVRPCSGFHSPLVFFLDQSLPLPRILCSWDHPRGLERRASRDQQWVAAAGRSMVSTSQLTASDAPFPQGQQGPSSQRGLVV